MKIKKSQWLFGIVIVLLVISAMSLLSCSKQTTIADPVLLRSAAAPAGVQPASPAQQTGVDTEPIQPVVVNLKDIPANVYTPNTMYERWQNGQIDQENEYRISELELADLKAEALSMPASENIQQATSGPGLKAPVPGIGFDSLDYTQCCGGGGSVPPDPEMAAGPNHLIAVVNVAFEIYDKTGTTLAGPTTFSSFFASLGGACLSNPFDPNVVYDEEADRWVIAADGDGTTYCIAVSQTADPTGSYNLYAVPAQPIGGEFHDYPHTGVGDTYIVAGANQFGGSIPGGFEGRVWAFDKSVMYAGGALTPVTASTGNDGTPQPLHLHGFSQGTWPAFGATHYFATDPYDGCTVNIWQWNIPTAPSIVATYNLCTATGVTGGMPVDFPQSGGSNIQANDWRMRGFEYNNGSGWIADAISCNPGAGTVDCARWHEVDLSGGTPSLVQAGVYASDSQYRVFPDLAVNQCNDMALGYTKSSTSMFPSVWYTGRENGDPLGTLQAEAELKAGEITYTAFDSVPHRWGDYTGMTIDPDGVTFWYLGEYSKDTGTTNGRWGNYIGSFTYPSCSGSGVTPDITLTKTVGTDPAVCAITNAITVTQGTDVTYCYSVENTGNVTFTQHTLTDSELGNILVDFPYSLVPGASAFITETTTILTSTVNTATWTASDPSVPVSALDIDTATVTVPPAEIGVDATGLGNTQAISNVVTYTLAINNTGGSTLNWMIDEDPLVAPLTSPVIPLPPAGSNTARSGSADSAAPISYDSPADFSEDFADITSLAGWFTQNNSNPLGSTSWFQGNDTVFPAHAGASTAYIAANFNNTAGVGTISNWLLTPELTLNNGDTFSFWTRTATGSIWPDRLEVRLSTAGASTNVGSGAADVGDFTTLLLEVNPTLTTGGYPEVWTQYTATLSSIPAGTTGRFAFRYYVTNGGPSGSNSNYIGIDTVEYVSNPVPTVCSAPTDIPWVSVSPASGSTDAGNSSDVSVVYDTNGLTVGSTYTGTLCINSNDPVTPLVTVPLTLTVEAQSFGVDLSANQAASGNVGTSVVYTLTVTNTGNLADTFDLSTSGTWTATLSQPTVSLAAGASTTFTVEVAIPSGAIDGEMNATTVTATSQNDATATDTTELTTTAIVEAQTYGVTLSGDQAVSADAGTTVVYTVTVTNTGTVEDTFDLTATGAWTADVSQPSITLAAGEVATFTVEVTVPSGASDGDSDVTTVTATSQSDPSATSSATLTTTAVVTEYKLFLPLIKR